MSDYPEEEDLAKIRTWSIQDPMGWVEFICDLWKYDDPYCRATQRRWYLSTGGWSGNEDIIAAMQQNFLWMFCFESHRRGGHYVFNLTDLKRMAGE